MQFITVATCNVSYHCPIAQLRAICIYELCTLQGLIYSRFSRNKESQHSDSINRKPVIMIISIFKEMRSRAEQ